MKRDELKRHAHEVARVAVENITRQDVNEYLAQTLDDWGYAWADDEKKQVLDDVQRVLEEADFSLEWNDDTCVRVCPGH